MSNPFDKHMKLVIEQYPEFDWEGWSIEAEYSEIEELEDSYFDINDRYNELIEEYFQENAMEQAISEGTVKLRPPKGYLFMRLMKENEYSILLLVKLP